MDINTPDALATMGGDQRIFIINHWVYQSYFKIWADEAEYPSYFSLDQSEAILDEPYYRKRGELDGRWDKPQAEAAVA